MTATQIILLVIVGVMAALAAVLVILLGVEARIAALRKQLRETKETVEESELVRDVVYVRIKEGRAGILDELPVREIKAEPVKKAPAAPVVEAYDPAATAIVSPKAEELAEPAVEAAATVAEAAETAVSENSRVIAVGDAQTFAQRLDALPAEARARYEDFVSYVLSKPDVKAQESKGYVMFKYKTAKMMRLIIRRDVPIAMFQLVNTELRRFVEEEDVRNIKISPVNIRITSDGELLAAKHTADLTISDLAAEFDYRKERKKQLRAERARQQRRNSSEA